MNANFFDTPPDPAVNPQGFQNQQAMANALMSRGSQQGKMVNGQYVAPSPLSYVNQLGGALASGYKNDQLRDASRASDILNGGTGQNGFQKVGGWLGGLFSGGA
jgi:hypothetical protein